MYFRVTEDEFHQFLTVCQEEGARSVSDLARSAVRRLIAECNREREESEVAHKVQVLEKLIAQVTAQLEMLSLLRENADRDNVGNGVSIAVAANNQNGKAE